MGLFRARTIPHSGLGTRGWHKGGGEAPGDPGVIARFISQDKRMNFCYSSAYSDKLGFAGLTP